MIGIPLGLLYANAGEWFVHKYLLHGLGVKKDSLFAFHWHLHHKHSRRNDQHDPDFDEPWYRELESGHRETGRTTEVIGLALAAAVHAPLFPVAPWFTATVMASVVNYYHVHKKSHVDPEWGRKHVPWHVDHHLGPNQHANWCVTKPWFDILMGTREPYVDTEREARDRARRAEHKARRERVLRRVGAAQPA